jgi:hypothetical protein
MGLTPSGKIRARRGLLCQEAIHEGERSDWPEKPPQLACYDMAAVGMGGFVTQRGWYEMGTYGSSKIKVSQFNINNAARSGSSKSSDSEESAEMKDVPELEIALRAMRIAAHHVQPWNFAFVALENFLLQNKFCEEDLKHDPQPARTLR